MQIIGWFAIGLCSLFVVWAWGYENSKRFWKGLLDRDRERARKKISDLTLRIAELADGLGGKCDKCNGFGVLGEDGNSDCWDCGGTGLKSLENYKNIKNKLLLKAKQEAQEVIAYVDKKVVPIIKSNR